MDEIYNSNEKDENQIHVKDEFNIVDVKDPIPENFHIDENKTHILNEINSSFNINDENEIVDFDERISVVDGKKSILKCTIKSFGNFEEKSLKENDIKNSSDFLSMNMVKSENNFKYILVNEIDDKSKFNKLQIVVHDEIKEDISTNVDKKFIIDDSKSNKKECQISFFEPEKKENSYKNALVGLYIETGNVFYISIKKNKIQMNKKIDEKKKIVSKYGSGCDCYSCKCYGSMQNCTSSCLIF